MAAVANVKVGHSQGAQYQTGQCQDWPLGDVGQGATAPLPPYRALVYISGRIADERGPGMLPILYFIDQYLIDLFIWVIIGSAILSWLIAFNVVNPYNQFVRSIWQGLNAVTEPLLRPIRRWMPDLGGIDISPVVLILLCAFVQTVVLPNIAKLLV